MNHLGDWWGWGGGTPKPDLRDWQISHNDSKSVAQSAPTGSAWAPRGQQGLSGLEEVGQ